MPFLNVALQGRFGNQTLQWLFARGLALRHGYELTCDEWIGERVFDVPVNRYNGPPLERHNEITIEAHMEARKDVEFRGYAQCQSCVTYTRKQVQEWLRFRPEILEFVLPVWPQAVVAHRRVGDYFGYGYPVLSKQAFLNGCDEWSLDSSRLLFVTEEKPMVNCMLPSDLSFVQDFYLMTRARVLMRANSTFSFVAGLLNNNIVLSPRIDGLRGGIEHDNVKFELGNHCRLADFDFCSDLVVP